jgi:hypothetical protein
MTCKYLYYVNKAYDIPLLTDEDSSVPLVNLISDIGVEFTVTFTLATNNTVTSIHSISNGKVVIDSTSITILILAGDITVPGYYNIKYDYTDNYGKARGVPPCPRRLRFYPQ